MSLTEDAFKRMLAARYLTQAIGSGPAVPWQVAARLSGTGLFDFPAESTEHTAALTWALRDQGGAEAQTPQLFVRIPSERAEDGPLIYETIDLLSARDPQLAIALANNIRSAVAAYATSSDAAVRASEYGQAAQAQKPEDMIRTGAELDEALSADWGWQVATLSQAWDAHYQDIIGRQLSRLLQFDLSDTTALRFLEDEFRRVLEELSPENGVATLKVSEARERLQRLGPLVGHLPWDRNVGFPSVLACVEADVLSSLWESIEAWSLETRPAWWFHAWFTAMCYPAVVPAPAWPSLWRRISILVSKSDKPYSEQNTEEKIWALYSSLLRFYVYRIEAALPMARSDFVMWCASTLASDIVGVVGASYAEAVEGLIDQVLDDAEHIWQVASPTIADSPLRSAFLEFGSWWPSAVQTSVTHWKDSLAAKQIPPDSQTKMERLVQQASARLFAGTSDGQAQEAPLMHGLTVLRTEWADVLGPSEVEQWIASNVALTAKLGSVDTVTEWITKPVNEDLEGLVALLRWLNFIRSGKVSMETAIDTIKSETWIGQVEPSLQTHALERIVFGILSARWIGRETLRVEIPHWAASRCLASLDHEDHRKLYCIATVLFSLKGGTASAVVRLRSEDVRNQLREDIAQLNNLLKRMLNTAPAWLCGRIRSVLAVLQE